MIILDGGILSEQDFKKLKLSNCKVIYAPSEWPIKSSNSKFNFNNFSKYQNFLIKILLFINFGEWIIFKLYRFKLYRGIFRLMNYLIPELRYQLDLLYRSIVSKKILDLTEYIIVPDLNLLRDFKTIASKRTKIFFLPPLINPKSIKNAVNKITEIKNKKLFFSGRMTKYRKQRLLSFINRDINIYKKSSKNIYKKYLAEVYIPQQCGWPYASIMRSYRTLSNGCLIFSLDSHISDAYGFLSPPNWIILENIHSLDNSKEVKNWIKKTLHQFEIYDKKYKNLYQVFLKFFELKYKLDI